jgi:ubiquinone/menaquinone biosynthesis C-methylase UbiE
MKAYYDVIGVEYARHRRTHPEVLRQLLGRPGLGCSSRIVEIGCGTGNYLAALGEALKCERWGIDPAESMLTQARQRCAGARLSVATAESTKLPHRHFDFAYCVDVVHHLADRPRAFRECRAILADGGEFCIVTDSPAMIRGRQPQSVYFPECVPPELARYPTPATLVRELHDAGFDDITTSEAEFRSTLASVDGYRAKVFSALKLMSDEAFSRGLQRLERDFAAGPIPIVSRYLLIWAGKIPRADPTASEL